jgi:hypothetical protein
MTADSEDSTTSKKMKTTEMKRVLVFGGKTGWIGNLMVELIEQKEGMSHACVRTFVRACVRIMLRTDEWTMISNSHDTTW